MAAANVPVVFGAFQVAIMATGYRIVHGNLNFLGFFLFLLAFDNREAIYPFGQISYRYNTYFLILLLFIDNYNNDSLH
jgi:hypothetical protein